MEAAHKLALSVLDRGEKPVVISAILKAWLTEGNRQVLNDAMDIHGGTAVVEGPNNYLALPWQSIPVAITVEGANILTRSMIVFGQGAIRAHPWLLKEMEAATDDDAEGFDRALFGHIGFFISNLVRAPLLGLSGGLLSRAPRGGETAAMYRRINRLSAGTRSEEHTSELQSRGHLVCRPLLEKTKNTTPPTTTTLNIMT